MPAPYETPQYLFLCECGVMGAKSDCWYCGRSMGFGRRTFSSGRFYALGDSAAVHALPRAEPYQRARDPATIAA